MPQEDDEFGEIALESGLPLHWAVYVGMWIFGMFAIVMGMAAQDASRDWKYLSYAIFKPTSFNMRLTDQWQGVLGLGYSHGDLRLLKYKTYEDICDVRLDELHEGKSLLIFHRRMFLYLVSIGLVFWFVCTVLKINPDTIPMYIPICANLGIFVSISIEHLWATSQANVRRVIRLGRDRIERLWSALQANVRRASRLTRDRIDHYWSTSKAEARRAVRLGRDWIAHVWSARGATVEEIPLYLSRVPDIGQPVSLDHDGDHGPFVD